MENGHDERDPMRHALPSMPAPDDEPSAVKYGAMAQHTKDVSPLTAEKGLPLNLILVVISYLDDAADLAAVTRTNRLLYYMTLPRLYENVTLRSFPDIRYVDGRPEGYGGGSPFAMGLNGLVARNVASYVKQWKVVGEWPEIGIDEYNKGRVPDNAMMLNIAVRAAMDKMVKLERFSWEMNTKPLATIYQGLVSRTSLTHFTLKFPTTRVPRPTVFIPPLPNLRSFVAINIDPLCSPDDISLLLFASRKLETLHLHFSPRMREVGEESIQMHTYFGRLRAENRVLRLKHFGIYNLYTRHTNDLDGVIDESGWESMTFINCLGNNEPHTVFLDNTWKINHSKHKGRGPVNVRTLRADPVDKSLIELLHETSKLEKYYIVNAHRKSKTNTPSSSGVSPSTPGFANTPNGGSFAAASPSAAMTKQEIQSIAGDFFAVITTKHGTNLKHLLLSDQWVLGEDLMFRLAQSCPNLEQLALNCHLGALPALAKLCSMLPKLVALRILFDPTTELQEWISDVGDDHHMVGVGRETGAKEFDQLNYFGLYGECFRMGSTVPSPIEKDKQGRPLPFRIVERLTPQEMKKVEIWGMDSTEVMIV